MKIVNYRYSLMKLLRKKYEEMKQTQAGIVEQKIYNSGI